MPRTLDTEFRGLSLRVEYDYDSAEPQTRDYPGCDASLEVTQVWVEVPQEFFEMFADELEELCWEDLNDMLRGKAEALAQDYLENREERLLHKRED